LESRAPFDAPRKAFSTFFRCTRGHPRKIQRILFFFGESERERDPKACAHHGVQYMLCFHLPAATDCYVAQRPTFFGRARRRFPRRTVIHPLGRARDSPVRKVRTAKRRKVRTGKYTFESQAGSARATPPAGIFLASAILNCPERHVGRPRRRGGRREKSNARKKSKQNI